MIKFKRKSTKIKIKKQLELTRKINVKTSFSKTPIYQFFLKRSLKK